MNPNKDHGHRPAAHMHVASVAEPAISHSHRSRTQWHFGGSRSLWNDRSRRGRCHKYFQHRQVYMWTHIETSNDADKTDSSTDHSTDKHGKKKRASTADNNHTFMDRAHSSNIMRTIYTNKKIIYTSLNNPCCKK